MINLIKLLGCLMASLRGWGCRVVSCLERLATVAVACRYAMFITAGFVLCVLQCAHKGADTSARKLERKKSLK
jgi:hypothetical protein